MTPRKSPRRLRSETVTIPLPSNRAVEVSIARNDGNHVTEIVFVSPPGKTGSDLHAMFRDLGVGLSRALQGRDPVTGEAVL